MQNESLTGRLAAIRLGLVIGPDTPGWPRSDDADNINGPCLVRAPSWVPNPLGQYYLYFGHHGGKYIRLSYADRPEGPWRIHGPGAVTMEAAGYGGLRGGGHVASPEVVVDETARRVYLFCHGKTGTDTPQPGRHASQMLVSEDGVTFAALTDLLMAKDEKGIVTYAVVAYRLQPDKAEKIWSIPAPTPMLESYGLTLANGHAYIDGTKEMFCIKLDDGKVVSTVKGAGGAGNQIAFAVDGRIFIQPEGHHGTQSFLMLDGNPQGFKLMGDLWIPPHTHCGAYSHHPVSYPLVDGRLIIRGRDGVYCYDLRAQIKP